MKKKTAIALVGLLVILPLLLTTCATMAKTDVGAFRRAVEEIWEKYSEALTNGDPDLFVAIHAEDVVKMAPGAPAGMGSQAVEKRIRGGLEAMVFEDFSIKLEEVEAFGDLGFARGTYTYTATVRANGQTIKFDGKYLTVFKKQPDGSWKIYRDCFNSNTP